MRAGPSFFSAAIVFILATSAQAPAQSSMESRVQRLEETILVLEQRVASLEAQLRERSAPTQAPSGKAKWRQLRLEMSMDEVRTLLGEPDRVDAGPVTFWYWADNASANFMRGKLTGWSEPRQE